MGLLGIIALSPINIVLNHTPPHIMHMSVLYHILHSQQNASAGRCIQFIALYKEHCRGVLKGFPNKYFLYFVFQITGKFTLSKVCRLPFLLILSHPLLIWFRILGTHPFTSPDPAQWPIGDEKIKFFLFFSFFLSIFHEYPFVNSFLLSYRTRYHVIAISSFSFSSFRTSQRNWNVVDRIVHTLSHAV